HWHPVAVNRNPVLIFSHIVIGAMAVGDVAAWHAVLRLDALEPRPHRWRDIGELAIVVRQSRRTNRKRRKPRPEHHRFRRCALTAAFTLTRIRTHGAPNQNFVSRRSDVTQARCSAGKSTRPQN